MEGGQGSVSLKTGRRLAEPLSKEVLFCQISADTQCRDQLAGGTACTQIPTTAHNHAAATQGPVYLFTVSSLPAYRGCCPAVPLSLEAEAEMDMAWCPQ